MTAAPVKPADGESAAVRTAVASPLFLAPPPTAKATARAALIAEARKAAEEERTSPPVLRFSAGT